MPNVVIVKAKSHLDKLVDKKELSKKNKQLIIDFVDKQIAEGHKKGAFSTTRIRKYIYAIISMSRITKKDFDTLTKNEVNKLAAEIRQKYHGETPRDYLVILRLFMRYVKELEGQEFEENEFPDIVKNIKPGSRKFPNIKKSELLTLDDVKILANQTTNLRNRAFILTLYETGCRISELIGDENYPGIRIGDIFNDEYGSIIDVDGKTGKRSLRVIACSPAISNWLQEHPDRENKKAFLFCGIWTNKGGKVLYRYWYNLLKKVGEKAGIKKPMNPHHYRHSRLSELARFMTEFQLCNYAGWEQGTKQARTYIKLSGKDTEDTILAMYGLKKEEKEENKLKPIICPRCNIKNDPAAKFCSGCSLGLDEKSMMEYDQQKEQATEMGMVNMEMLKDPKFREFYNDMLALTWDKYRKMKEK